MRIKWADMWKVVGAYDMFNLFWLSLPQDGQKVKVREWKKPWLRCGKCQTDPASWGSCNAWLFWGIIRTKGHLLLHHSKTKLTWYFVFCLPIPCGIPGRKLRWWKEPWSQGIQKDKLFSLFSMWLTGENIVKAGATIYVHDVAEKEVTLKVKG